MFEKIMSQRMCLDCAYKVKVTFLMTETAITNSKNEVNMIWTGQVMKNYRVSYLWLWAQLLSK